MTPLEEPEGTEPVPTTRIEPGEEYWHITRDLVGYRSELHVVKDLGEVCFDDIDLTVTRRADEVYDFYADDFSSPRGRIDWVTSFRRGDWHAATSTHTELACTPTEFRLHARMDAYEHDKRVFSRNWRYVIPRDHV